MNWEKELEDWEEKYGLVENFFAFEENGRLEDKFETYGEELDFVRAQDPRCVWTLVDGDDGNLYIVNGYHLVNRVNYFVTKKPFEGEFMEVPYYIYEDEEKESEGV